ncbi:hypothetical protein ACMA1I_14525 [Pontibacter sp. 13R65]|uniref:hypothetical protein n=1 Tax=Pontibacter sp. 13R65 TaxID=3127458 RepID=UPI00301BFDEA
MNQILRFWPMNTFSYQNLIILLLYLKNSTPASAVAPGFLVSFLTEAGSSFFFLHKYVVAKVIKKLQLFIINILLIFKQLFKDRLPFKVDFLNSVNGNRILAYAGKNIFEDSNIQPM